MNSEILAFIVGIVIGLVIVAPILWRYCAKIKQSWQAALGISPGDPVTVSEPSHSRGDNHRLFPGKRWLAIGLSLMASLANAVLAVQTSDGRSLYVFGAVLFAIATVLLVLAGRSREA